MVMSNWIWWAIPEKYIRRYLIFLWLILFIIPGYGFGIQYTKLGLIVNWLWYDIVFYGWAKTKEQIEKDLDK